MRMDIEELRSSKEKCFVIGKIRKEVSDFLNENVNSLSTKLKSDEEILFWKERIAHTELHKNDFISDNEFLNCFENIPNIIENPDYISVHPKDNSISFIKDFSEHVSVAIRVSTSGKLSYRTMYPIYDATLEDYMRKGRAWKIEYQEDGNMVFEKNEP